MEQTQDFNVGANCVPPGITDTHSLIMIYCVLHEENHVRVSDSGFHMQYSIEQMSNDIP